MVLDRLKQVAQHVTGTAAQQPHPFDPLSETEIERAVGIVRKEHDSLSFNTVTLWEPRKAEMLRWLADPDHTPRPHRVADIVALAKGGKLYDGLVDLEEGKIVKWECAEDVQPLVRLLSCVSLPRKLMDVQITVEELQIVERIVRTDPKVIEQCALIGIPKEDMHKVYCDRQSNHVVFALSVLLLTFGSLDHWT